MLGAFRFLKRALATYNAGQDGKGLPGSMKLVALAFNRLDIQTGRI